MTSFQKVTEGSLMQTINPLRVTPLGDHDLRQWVTGDKNHKPHLWGAGQAASGATTAAWQNQPTEQPKAHLLQEPGFNPAVHEDRVQ